MHEQPIFVHEQPIFYLVPPKQICYNHTCKVTTKQFIRKDYFMYHILIVEDEQLQQTALVRMLQEYNNKFYIDTATTYDEAVLLSHNDTYDIIFLDLKLEEQIDSKKNGLQLALYFRSLKSYAYTPMIFITSIPEYIHQALNDAMCFQYILKPYTSEDIKLCLDKLLNSPLITPRKFSFESYYGGKIQLQENDILYFYPGTRRHLCIHTFHGTYETTEFTLDYLEHILPKNFLRCHRKYIVNTQHITYYDKGQHFLRLNDTELPVGRNYKSLIDIYWSEHYA